jgi:hypothetical protein
MLGQQCGPRPIYVSLHSMLTPIQFDHQVMFETAEVSNEGADRMLAPEFGIAQLSVAQPCPEPLLDRSLVTAQAASSVSKC